MSKGTKPKIILMYGGRSGEHEISLLSAASVLSALDNTQYHIECIAGDKLGRWYKTPYEAFQDHDPQQPLPVKTPLSKEFVFSEQVFKGVYAVLPIMHGPLYEDGCLQGALTLFDVPFVGSDTMSSANAMDKEMAKIVAAHYGIPVAPYFVLKDSQSQQQQEEMIAKLVPTLSYPLFIKPATLGSSVGIHRVDDHTTLTEALQDAFRYDRKVLVEKGIKGREIEVAVLKQRHDITVSLPGEICMKKDGDFYSYQAKYLNAQAAQLKAPCELSEEELFQIQTQAKTIFKALDCEGLARVDFFLEESSGKFILNEVNTLPGFTKISMYPKLWQLSGVPYPKLLTMLIEQARWLYNTKNSLVRDYS